MIFSSLFTFRDDQENLNFHKFFDWEASLKVCYCTTAIFLSHNKIGLKSLYLASLGGNIFGTILILDKAQNIS